MKNLETKKLTRSEMKSVLGGVGRVCVGDTDCPTGEYCNTEGNRNQCKKKDVPVETFAAKKTI